MSNELSIVQTPDPIMAFVSRLPDTDLLSRSEIASALMISTRTLANRESNGTGIGNVVRIGCRVFHYRNDVIEWVKNRINTASN